MHNAPLFTTFFPPDREKEEEIKKNNFFKKCQIKRLKISSREVNNIHHEVFKAST